MKQKIALLLTLVLAVSMMSLIGCKKTGEETEPSTSEPTQESTEPGETTPPATDPTEDYKNDIAYYPFPLLNMTVGEIEQKYGKVIYEGPSQGTAECSLEGYEDIWLVFDIHIDDDKLSDPNNKYLITSDLIPECLHVWGNVYPGIKTGMKHGEFDFRSIENCQLNVYCGEELTAFKVYEDIQVENCKIRIRIGSYLPWEIVEKYLGYNITQDEAFHNNLFIEPKDIQNWLEDGHMDEIADLEIASIEIYRN
ncbi:MAG: hypothetical protein HFE77_00730 [Clostridiales bacterium]|nr:hypothetical protein [Clostridiales bacterium]